MARLRPQDLGLDVEYRYVDMYRFATPENVTWRYSFRSPGGRHKQYRLIKTDYSGKTQKQQTLNHPTLESLNKAYLSGKLDSLQMERQLRELIERLYKKDGVRLIPAVFNSDNEELLDQFFDHRNYFKRNKDPSSAMGDYKRAVKALGNVSLRAAGQAKIQRALDDKFSGSAHARAVERVNTLLKWIGRSGEVHLSKDRKPLAQPDYITERKFKSLLVSLPHEVRIASTIAFYSGLRVGEVMGLSEESLRGRYLWVNKQLDDSAVLRETKNRKARYAFLFPQGRQVFEEWLDIKDQILAGGRNKAFRKQWRQQLYFGCDSLKIKRLSPHDLRHSYAIMLLNLGWRLADVARSLGNSQRVAEDYYVGFELTEDTREALADIIDKQVSKTNVRRIRTKN